MVGSSIDIRARARAAATASASACSRGARHHDALAEQRQALVPVELSAQPHHLADDDRGGRLHPALARSARAASRASR